MEKVVVSKGLLIGLAVTCLSALFALVFFVGLEFGRKGLSLSQNGASASPRTAATAEPSPISIADSIPRTRQGLPSPPNPAAIPSNPGMLAADPLRASVVAYFEAVDHIQPGKLEGDAQGMANEMAAALTKGDTSGLDGLIQQSESSRKRLAALSPPQPCASYHRESLASLDEGIEMMRSIKKAMDTSDANALSALTSRGNALRSHSEALEREEKAIRQHYGLLH